MTQTLLMLLIRWLSVTLQANWGCSYITSFIKCCWDMQNKCQKYNFPFDPDVNPISYCGLTAFQKMALLTGPCFSGQGIRVVQQSSGRAT